MQVAAGSMVAGYRIEALIGKGGMGTVYRATQVSLDRPVALKLLDRNRVHDPAAVSAIIQEARAAARVHHAHLIAVHDTIEDATTGAAGYAMELFAGQPSTQVGRMDRAQCLRVMHQVAQALGAAHRAGLVHRDVAPGNILIGAGVDGAVAKLLDLGLARDRLRAGSATPGPRRLVLLGTPGFIAPEQIRNPERSVPASDVYALACCAVWWLTGRTAHGGDTLIDHAVLCASGVPELDDAIPDDLGELLSECLDPDTAERPADGVVLAERCDALRQGTGKVQRSPLPRAAPRPSRLRRRRR
jgi:serine/threonine protein kinase